MIKWIKSYRSARREKRYRFELIRLRSMMNEIDHNIVNFTDIIKNMEVQAQEFIVARQPILINLVTGKRSQICDLSCSSLGISISELASVGTGVIIYYDDAEKVKIGYGAELRDFSIFEVMGKLEIGNNCVIGSYNWFQSSGSISIGNGCIIGPHCCVISTSHRSPAVTPEVRSSPLIKGSIKIGDNTWIGAHVSILKDVNIGKNVTIGAGSVVTKDIPDNATAFGSPCEVHVRI